MKVEREVYIIASKNSPIQLDDGRGNPVDDIKDAYLYKYYTDAEADLDTYDDDVKDEYRIVQGSIIFDI